MSKFANEISPELAKKFLELFREENGSFELVDERGLIEFIAEHGERYPELVKLFTLDIGAVIEHFEETGEVIPGVKLIRKTQEEGSNVTRVEIFEGPRESKSEDAEVRQLGSSKIKP